MLPRRHQNSGRQHTGKRFPAHLQWVRGHICAVRNDECGGNIEAAHIEGSGTKGIGMKAADVYVIPLCSAHHAARHKWGWQTFDRCHQLDALELAKALAAKSPHVQRAARERGFVTEDAE